MKSVVHSIHLGFFLSAMRFTDGEYNDKLLFSSRFHFFSEFS